MPTKKSGKDGKGRRRSPKKLGCWRFRRKLKPKESERELDDVTKITEQEKSEVASDDVEVSGRTPNRNQSFSSGHYLSPYFRHPFPALEDQEHNSYLDWMIRSAFLTSRSHEDCDDGGERSESELSRQQVTVTNDQTADDMTRCVKVFGTPAIPPSSRTTSAHTGFQRGAVGKQDFLESLHNSATKIPPHAPSRMIVWSLPKSANPILSPSFLSCSDHASDGSSRSGSDLSFGSQGSRMCNVDESSVASSLPLSSSGSDIRIFDGFNTEACTSSVENYTIPHPIDPVRQAPRSQIDTALDSPGSLEYPETGLVKGETATMKEFLQSSTDEETSVMHLATSLEDLGLSETGNVAAGGVVTKFGSMGGAIKISSSVKKIIPLEGVLVNVGGCLVQFPPDSFGSTADVDLTAEIDSSKWPGNFTAYTPTLYVTAKGLRKKLHIKLPSWRVCSDEKKSEAYIFHNWARTNTTLPVPHASKPYFEFYWGDFSPIAVGSPSNEVASTNLRLSGALFVSDYADVSVVYHVNDQTQSSSESLILEAIRHDLRILHPPRRLRLPLQPFTAKRDEEIKTLISCTHPTDVNFHPSDPFILTIDEEFEKTQRLMHSGAVAEELGKQQRILLQCSAWRGDGKKIGNPSTFSFTWNLREGSPERKKRKFKDSIVNVSLNHIRNLAAGNYGKGNSRISSHPSSSKTRIGAHLGSPDEDEEIDEDMVSDSA